MADFRDKLSQAAGDLGFNAKQPQPEEIKVIGKNSPKASEKAKAEINQFDRVFLKPGCKVIEKYRNSDGSLRGPSIGETPRMGYKDADDGFIVKQKFTDPILGEVVEIEPVNYSYQKDKGTTYLAKPEDVKL